MAHKTKEQIKNLARDAIHEDYVERFNVFSGTQDNSWHTITLTGISANTIIFVCIHNDTSAAKNGGVREVGSSLDRQGVIPKDSRAASLVKTNASSQIEVYTSDYATMAFVILDELVKEEV